MTSISLVLLAFSASAWAGNTPCATQTYKGEELLQQGDTEKAEPILEAAVKACRGNPREKSARPFIALGTLYFRTQRAEKAIPLFEEGLKHEPGLTLAYMNLSAAYHQLKNFPKAVENGKKAIELAHGKNARLEAQANFNVGLALFTQAAEAGKEDDLTSEPFFTASQKLMPSIDQNYFYLGVINEIIKKKPKEALAFYHQGCELKHTQSCTYGEKLRARGGATEQAGAPAGKTAPAAKVALTPEEKELYAKIRAKFIARGIAADKVDTMLTDMQKNYAALPVDTRKTALRSIASQ